MITGRAVFQSASRRASEMNWSWVAALVVTASSTAWCGSSTQAPKMINGGMAPKPSVPLTKEAMK